jgi:hypothetical protein
MRFRKKGVGVGRTGLIALRPYHGMQKMQKYHKMHVMVGAQW